LSTDRRIARAAIVVAAAVAVLVPASASAAEPVVGVWYRGNPAGTPRQSDLGAIRALGFTGVTWPRSSATGVEELIRLAGLVGLKVVIADGPPAPIDGRSALRPPARVDIAVASATPGMISALAWRAVAHGARVITFDAATRTGAGLEETDRSLKPWARTAINVSRQLNANANLATAMRPGPGLILTPAPPPALDVVLLDADRSWVIVATNTSGSAVSSRVRLPAGTPYALWVSWLEGSPLAMISEPAGPRWMLRMEPRSAQVYIIDKIMK
jgi:hypothetical protein